MPGLERVGDVFVLDLGGDENTVTPERIAAIDDALRQVERADGDRALVTTAGGKYYSTGLDLGWVEHNPDGLGGLLALVDGLYARLLALPLITVAAMPGHAFAAGAMLALAHDFRVMRADRGYWCLSEVDVGIAFTPGMARLIRERLAPQVAHEAMTTAKRYGGREAQQIGIVDEAVAADVVLERALAIAQANAAKAGPTLGTIKARLSASTLAALGSR